MTDDEKDALNGNETCQRCGMLGQDRRTLWMACFYAMNKLGLPLKQVSVHGVVLQKTGKRDRWGTPDFEDAPHGYDHAEQSHHHPMFTLRVCKACRAEWIETIKAWFNATPDPSIAESNNDATDYLPNDTLPAIVAELERLRVEATAIAQRIEVYRASARAEESRRAHEDSTESPE